ncbi:MULTISPECIES: phosphoenolpyruvate--protein phosphotransferase [Proteus]|jgi:phosphotransferase system enzyme I (PtsP)|uniref:phosphoenolpyruvate--protein phosphotransferase n=2 Tax=Enterobacterales TaxID=91347 RepID=A0A379FAN3_PROVU|nr:MULTISPECIES: phosphoenolpyruvate--protein phosphotransferase [Proteus]EBW1656273.1 phosphoenolpyruvate-protein phosphotransferase PtsP [Salmonella enterica subsp. enterica serovar Typhimurium]NBN59364.1 phosphoenolpyruvate--protein phosphotransferase [Proteus sp. G2639]RNT24234.1 phosphoenolpyruvate-protein phosphotransferase PtsP [Proteus mirabilis]AYY81864.1 phosphoenolpyruvate-protein phosphotransferase PtsP [Proteus vulgaris]KGA57109.1 phosphoenolpyruvate-protein phosphotransferase [Pr
MLTRLREIVEKVAMAAGLPEALELLVKETCQAMHTDVCSIYLADKQRRCFYLMATKGLKKPRGRAVSLSFDEGVVGEVGRLSELINLADIREHPSFKYLPQVKEDDLRAFLGVPIVYRRQLLGILVVQQKERRLFNESEESFMVTLATQLGATLSQVQTKGLFGQYRQSRIKALSVSTGVVMAYGWQEVSQPILENVFKASALDIKAELNRLTVALEEATAECRRFSKRFMANAQKESAAIFDLYSHLLNDPQLKHKMTAIITQGYVAEWAVKVVVEKVSAQFSSLKDGYMRERASDLKALGRRLLFHLDDEVSSTNIWPERFILVADELSASLLAELPEQQLAGVIVRDGATHSHSAILVRAMGIPAIMGADIQPELLHNRMLILDGYRGEIFIEPEPFITQEYKQIIDEESVLSQIAEDQLEQQAVLKNGEAVSVQLNAGLNIKYEQRISLGIDGVGLYRTEIPFMLQSGFPSEDEQKNRYREILSFFPDKPVVLRALDIGADKQLPYMPINEENPCLGWRGIRILLDQPEIFLIQLRAMLKANLEFKNLKILLPMVTSIDEIDEARTLLLRACDEVSRELKCECALPPLGIMLEVPSLVFMLSQLVHRVDFISIGTNDLTQYLLAVDRNNTHVASLYDNLHPALLRSLSLIATQCQYYQLPISVCGEMAGTPIGALLLIGLGFRQLSMSGRSLPRVKYLLRHLDPVVLQPFMQQVLQAETATEIKKLSSEFMERQGLGGLIRGGI